MKLSQFKFKLPEELIALEPSYHRDECRLMVVHRKSGTIDMFQKDDKGQELKDADGNSTARRRRKRQRSKCSCCVS